MRYAIRVFLLSILISFVILLLNQQYQKMLVYMPLFAIGSITLFALNSLFVIELKVKLMVFYPISFTFSVIAIILVVAWLSDNNIKDTFQKFYASNDEFSFSGAYIIANSIIYLLSFNKIKNLLNKYF